MGLSGADVAKSVSDIVLADDNFASITRAIRKGRGTLMNLSKFLLYLLSGNIAEVLVLIVGLAFLNKDKVSVYPLSPVAALWINTIAAGPPALALGLEPTAKDAMEKSPRAYKTIFTLWWYIDLIFYGILIGSLSIANFVIVVWGKGDGDLGINCNEGSYNNSCETRKFWSESIVVLVVLALIFFLATVYYGRGTTFATLTIILMVHSLECKHLEKSIFQMDLMDNKLLLWSAFALSLSVFPVLYIPKISDYAFQVLGLKWEWGIVFGMVLVYLVCTELYKMLRRRLNKEESGGPKVTEKNLPRFETIAP
jgi:magnesium-transporting ATPase (P-type)